MLAREANLLPWYSAAADVLFAHYTRQLSVRAETMFWAVENPSPSISKCLDGGFVSYVFVSLLIDSLILGIRARADGENL
jgi:hypothetical protein